MTEHIRPFNRIELLDSDLALITEPRNTDISGDVKLPDKTLDRMVDRILQPGLRIPTFAIPEYINTGLEDKRTVPSLATTFPIIEIDTTHVTVCNSTGMNAEDFHVAYDRDGQRIQIPMDDNVTFDATAPSATTPGFTGTTPFSTGRKSILLSGAVGDRFIFIGYTPVVRTENLPPDYGMIGAQRNPVSSIDELTGLVYAHQRINGYVIYVATLADLDPGPKLKDSLVIAGLPVPSKAVYLGRVGWSGSAITNVIGGSSHIVLNDSTYPRALLRLTTGEVATLDSSLRTQVYGAGQVVTFPEHAMSLGTAASVTPVNPHKLHINDIEGGAAEPKNILYQKESLVNGIIDPAISRTVPASLSTAMACSIQIVPLVTSKYFAEIPMSGVPEVMIAPINTSQSIVKFNQLAAQSAYISGVRFDRVSPVIVATSECYVPFNSTGPNQDGAGIWVIFAINSDAITDSVQRTNMLNQFTAEGNTSAMLLGKYLLSAGSLGDPNAVFAFPNTMEICRVYWDGTSVLQHSPYNTTVDVEDTRSLGLVSTPNIATKAQVDPLAGMFTNQKFCINRMFNGDFSYNALGTTSADWWKLGTTPAPSGTLSIKVIDSATGPDNQADMKRYGPKTDRGAKLVLTPAGTTLHVALAGQVSSLKPSTKYTMSAWMWAYAPAAGDAKVNISAMVDKLNTSTGVPLNDPRSLPRNILLSRTGSWQKVSQTFTTLQADSLVSENVGLVFYFDSTVGTGPFTLWMTNMMFTEGEWVGEFVPSTREWGYGLSDYRIQTNLNTGGAGNWATALVDVFNKTIYSTGEHAFVHAKQNVLVTNGSSMQGYAARLILYVDGSEVSSSRGLHDHPYGSIAQNSTIWTDTTFPLSVSWVGYLTPGIHQILVKCECTSRTGGNNHHTYFDAQNGTLLRVRLS
jgi:hypothetical protein